MIPIKLIDTAKRFIKRDEPFGPTTTERIKDKSVADLLFDRENKLYHALDENPSIILGRRGSGKTAYLESAYFLFPHDVIIEIRQEKLFDRVLTAVENIVKGAVLAETVSDVWRTLLLIVAFQKLVAHEEELGQRLSIVRDYLGKLGVREDQRADDILWNIVDLISERLKDKPIGILAEALKFLDNVTFEKALNEATAALSKKRLRCILLIDSLESYPFDIPSVTHAIRGLLKCIGAFNSMDDRFEVRFCLPAELYHTFIALSSNPLKDFDKGVTLHWHPKELLFIIAKRVLLYSELYDKTIYETIQHLEPDNKSHALTIFFTVFPNKIKNGLEYEENTLAYILRHTQLLPRQLLRILNSIAHINRKLHGKPLSICPQAVVRGIKTEERMIADEIFSGFAARYSNARKCCESCIPELYLTFGHGDLHKVFTRFGKKHFETGDFDDFKRMLIEIGAIGRLLDNTELYHEGAFEYTEPHKLTVSTDDRLCIHPIFAGAFGSKIAPKGAPKITVYPYGANPDIDDWRVIS